MSLKETIQDAFPGAEVSIDREGNEKGRPSIVITMVWNGMRHIFTLAHDLKRNPDEVIKIMQTFVKYRR